MGFFSSLREHFKGASTPLERKLVLKLDFFILTFCCLAYFMNYLDRASITQAYVSGMREDLGFKGAQLTVVTTLYATAYLIFFADYSQISGIITLPVAVYGYFFFPDTPHTTTAFYLSQEEIALAKERVPIHEDDKTESIMSKSFLSRVVHSWYFYAFCFLWILGNCSESQSNQSLLNLYMQSHPTEKYNLYQRNNYPTGVQAMGVTSTLLWATSTDIWGRRWLSGYYVCFTAIANAAIILAPTSTAAKFGAYYWAGSIYCIQATFFAWANDSMRNESPRLRSCVIACMNAAGNCFQAWWPLIFYRADDAPEFKKGMIAMIAVGTTMAIWVTVLILVEKRRAKTELQVIEAVVEERGLESEGPTKLDSTKLDSQISDVKPSSH
ncbi:hypothetical protein CaCOL14_003270 [Colletotrichum acutatum]